MPTTIVSAMRPTGGLHLGNLEIAKYWTALQNQGCTCYFFSADYHAETTCTNGNQEIKNKIIVNCAEFIATGIDHDKAILFIQSQIPELAELHLILSNLIAEDRLRRNPVYKEMAKQLGIKSPTYLFLGYPVLQAADILLYKGEEIPIGEDQLPHVEITRELTVKFNKRYCEIFPVPKPKVISIPRIPGLDGRKMSKSYDNHVELGDTEEDTRQKIMRMMTDPQRRYREEPGHPEECPVFCLQRIYNTNAEDTKFACKTAAIGCTDCKALLAEKVNHALKEIRSKRKVLLDNQDQIMRVLKLGCEKARIRASETITEVRKIVHGNMFAR